MAKKTRMTAPALSESNWQARSDANALREAGLIKADAKRLKAAQNVARQEADAFRRVAGRGGKSK